MKNLLPKKNAPAKPTPGVATSSPIAAGTVVMFENDGQAQLAIVTGEKKGKLQLLTMREREVELPAFRLFSFPEAKLPEAQSRPAQAAWLLSKLEQSSLSELVDLAELHELALIDSSDVGKSGESSTRVLAGLIFSSPSSFEQILALRLALIGDRVFFKRHGDDLFSPRPQETVEQLKHADALRRARADRLERLSRIFVSRLSAPKSDAAPADLSVEDRDSVQLLLRVGSENPDVTHEERRAVKELMQAVVERAKLEQQAPGSDEQRALFLLDRARLIDPDENLSVIRHGVQRAPTAAAEAEAARLCTQPVKLSPHRRDLTHLWCCTIDDVTTKDMDDALSLEQLEGGGYRVGIHISDCGSLVPAHGINGVESALDLNARERATSLYLGAETVHMLPVSLSEDYASLRAGELRYAHSVLVSFDSHLEISGFEVCQSLVRSAVRFTYDDVDQILQSGAQDVAGKTLRMLRDIAESHERFRFDRGASASTKREVIVSRNTDGTLRVQVIDERSPARLLVAELMVLGNRCLAEFARDNRIPVVYRAQDKAENVTEELQPEPSSGGNTDSGETAPQTVTRRIMKKSFVGFEPQPHAGLALPVYIQATSPIRRYIDMCHQRQISSFLATGKPLYSEEQFKEILMRVEPSLATAQAVSKETKRYWHLVYLQEFQRRNELLDGTVARRDTRTPLVEIECIATTLFARLKPNTPVGARVKLRIIAVRPREGFARLEEV